MPRRQKRKHTRLPELGRRAVPLPKPDGDGPGPATLDRKTRSVEVVAATENPVDVYDWELGRVPEYLLMQGCQIPESRQVPLLDTHSRWSTQDVIGSARELRVEGDRLMARAVFASDERAEQAFEKIAEGHLTDFSIGYRRDEFRRLKEGETAVVYGRKWKGPAILVTRWTPRELSACPIGADEAAKARADDQPIEEVTEMNEKLRKLLEKLGLRAEADTEEALRFLEEAIEGGKLTVAEAEAARAGGDASDGGDAAARADGGNVISLDDYRAKIRDEIRAERERVAELTAMAERFDLGDRLSGWIRDGVTVDRARAEALEVVAERAEKAPTPAAHIEVGLEDRDKFRAAAQDALLVRGGIIEADGAAAGHDELLGMSLVDMARESLRMAGQGRLYGDPRDVVGRALSTSDFPNILANVANKSLFTGFDTAEETWRLWCATGQVSDFKTHTLVSVSEASDLDQIDEDEEYKHGKRTEAKEEYRIATYGKLFVISRQTIINDDLQALTDIPRAHGEAAARKVGDVAYAELTTNPTMGDGVALFHSNHGNLGTAGAPSETTIAELIKLMKLHKDLQGKRRLNIRPRFFIAPVALEGSAEVFFNSMQFHATDTGATRANPYAGTYFTRVYEPRLDDDSATAWYLAGPRGKTVVVYFLNGVQRPYLETRNGWTVDGVEYKVRIDAGAKAVSWKALAKNPGA
ncbi:prohead protease/major capsid protein fusion protein [Deferrisoma camini]|uniref:prohead protease/major capsid protein fusion protein n=1 Tax=Deferrisoma camini TaxID=1035120 RepID=UPI0004AFD786|nr:prohead protease/major capsid protein fusion protein [Deferrisoma camini]